MAQRDRYPRGSKAASLSLPAIVSSATLAGCVALVPAAEPPTLTAPSPSVAINNSQIPVANISRPRDQLWVVSCRGIALHGPDSGIGDLSYSLRQPGGWSVSNREAFHTAVPATTTCVLVLGNGYTAAETRSLGQTAYRRLTAALPAELPVRFVVWSWPSDKTDAGPIKDLRIKAGRTPGVAACLARWLDGLSSQDQVSLLGTSFGARIVLEALELRSGSQVAGLRIENSSDVGARKFNVVLISAAIDSHWLESNQHLGHSPSQIDRLLLVNNSSDSVLKRYHWLYGPRSKAAALGTVGLRTGNLSVNDFEQIDAAGIIGRQHGCAPYFESPRLVAAMRSCLFPERELSPEVPTEGIPIPVAARPERAVR